MLGAAEGENEYWILLPSYPAMLAIKSPGEEGKASTSTASLRSPPPRAFSFYFSPFLGLGVLTKRYYFGFYCGVMSISHLWASMSLSSK